MPERRVLTGPRADSIVAHASRLLDDPEAYQAMANAVNPYGDGRAAARIVARVRDYLSLATPGRP